MGGRVPYGYELENIVMDGIKTCMYRPIPEQIQIVKLIYALYSQPQVSFADIIKYLSTHGIKNQSVHNFSRMRVRDIITIELTKLKIRAEEIEKEIATLIDKIVSASPATMEYINERIDALDEEKKSVQIAQTSAEMYGKRNIGTIRGYINDWEGIDMDDKLTVVDALIDTIRVGQGDVQIT